MNLIAFDMDGVIVDVSSSYREMIPLITRKFFDPSPDAAALPTPIVSLEDVALIRNQGGWNNDWDLSALVISLALSTIPLPVPESAGDAWTLWRTTLQSCKLDGLIDFLTSMPMPISTRFRQLGAFRHPFVDLMDRGDVETGNVIRRLFQELYLGSDLFRATYSLEAKSHQGPGLIETERLLIPVSFFERLSEQHILAIATGRPFAEAFYTLRLFGIENYFSRILTLDDCDLATDWTLTLSQDRLSLEKPDPFMLNAIYAGLEQPVDGRFYIGDMPDDMKAAKRAKPSFKAIGLLSSDASPEELKRQLLEAGADMLVESVDELERIVTGNGASHPVHHAG